MTPFLGARAVSRQKWTPTSAVTATIVPTLDPLASHPLLRQADAFGIDELGELLDLGVAQGSLARSGNHLVFAGSPLGNERERASETLSAGGSGWQGAIAIRTAVALRRLRSLAVTVSSRSGTPRPPRSR